MERLEWDCFVDETKEKIKEVCDTLNGDDDNTVNNVVVWFHAEWCNPCKRIEPEVLELVQRVTNTKKTMLFYDVLVPSDDIEKNELKELWGFQTIPTFFIVDVKDETITEKKWGEFKDFALSSN